MSTRSAFLIAGLAAGGPALWACLAGASAGAEVRTAGVEERAEEAGPFRLPAAGESVQRRLDEAGLHRYAVPAAPGTYLRIVLWEQGSDVALRLLDPSGEVAAETEHPGRRPGALLLDALLEAEGDHRLEVVRRSTIAKTEMYRLRLEALRPATAEDRAVAPARQRAADLLTEALTLMQEDREEQTRAAIERCREALSLWREGGDAFGEAWTLHALGLLHARLEEGEEAAAGFRAATASWERAGDEIGWAWSSMASSATLRNTRSAEAYEAARAALERSLEIFRGAADPFAEAQSLNEIGFLFRYLPGRQDQEVARLLEALEIRERVGDRYGQAETLLNLGVGHWNRGQTGQALDCFERALALRHEIADEGMVANTLISLGAVYRRMGELHEALDYYTEAEPVALRSGNRRIQALLWYNRAVLYHHLGDWDEAALDYQKSLPLYRQVGDWVHETFILRNLGLLQYARGNLDEALDLIQQAVRLSEEAGESRDLRSAGLALQSRGVLRASLGMEEEALSDLTAALAVWKQMKDRISQAEALSDIAKVHLDSGRMEVAERLLTQARELNAEGDNEMVEALTLTRLAELHRARGDLEAAVESLETVLEIYESQRRSLFSAELRASFLAARRPRYEDYVDLLVALDAQNPGEGFDAQALRASERARARGLAELLTEARIDLGDRIGPELQRLEDDLDKRITVVQQRLVQLASDSRTTAEDLAALRLERQDLRRDQVLLEARIRKADPRYAEVAYPAPLSREEIQSLLDEETAFLEYMLGEKTAFVFVITHDRLSVHKLEIEPVEIEALVTDLREALVQRSPLTRATFPRVAHRLYRELLVPASALLAGKSRLVIAPDRHLYYLPFEALVTAYAGGATGHLSSLPYLIQDYRITYVPSATVLAILSRPQRQEEVKDSPRRLDLVAFADPVYDPARAGDPAAGPDAAHPEGGVTRSAGEPVRPFPRLEGSREEVEAIARLFAPDRVRLYTGQAASESRLKAEPDLPLALRLHFATHGIVDEEEPSNTGLVLSLDEKSEDGFLQLREIFDLEVTADLVVLSACSTGLGQPLRGEGLVGLSRAFMYAGAENLLVSLWRVEDKATSRLILRFYRQLTAGEEISEALRKAKLQALAEEPAFHPGHWAPFILIGSGA